MLSLYISTCAFSEIDLNVCASIACTAHYAILLYVLLFDRSANRRCGTGAAAANPGAAANPSAAAAVEVRPAYIQFDTTVLLTADADDACIAPAAADQTLARQRTGDWNLDHCVFMNTELINNTMPG